MSDVVDFGSGYELPYSHMMSSGTPSTQGESVNLAATSESMLAEVSELGSTGRAKVVTGDGFKNLNAYELLEEAERRRQDDTGLSSRIAIVCPETRLSDLISLRTKLRSMGVSEYLDITVKVHADSSTEIGVSDDVWDLSVDDEEVMGDLSIHIYPHEFFDPTKQPLISLSDRLQQEVSV